MMFCGIYHLSNVSMHMCVCVTNFIPAISCVCPSHLWCIASKKPTKKRHYTFYSLTFSASSFFSFSFENTIDAVPSKWWSVLCFLLLFSQPICVRVFVSLMAVVQHVESVFILFVTFNLITYKSVISSFVGCSVAAPENIKMHFGFYVFFVFRYHRKIPFRLPLLFNKLINSFWFLRLVFCWNHNFSGEHKNSSFMHGV